MVLGVIVPPVLGTKVAAFRCSVLILLPTAFILLGVAGAVLGAGLPAGLNTGADTDADMREGDVVGEMFESEPAELMDTGKGRAEGFGLNGWAVAEVPNAEAASDPRDRLYESRFSAEDANVSGTVQLTLQMNSMCRSGSVTPSKKRVQVRFHVNRCTMMEPFPVSML